MASYLTKVLSKAAKFDHFTLLQVPRDQNSHVDALANLESALQNEK